MLRMARLEGWPRGPWFETALKKRLLIMRFLCGGAASPFSSTRVGRRPVPNSQ
jgi:hypothetical protein